MTLLYVVRHAEAEGNIFRRLHGQYNSRLTADGLRQLEALEKRFSGVPIDAVYSSDLCRACQTAQAICGPKGLPLRRDPRLREVGVGVWEDRCVGELERTDAEQLRLFMRHPEAWSVPGAESFAAFCARFAAALTEIAEAHPGQSVTVVSHGCVISGGFCRLLGLEHNSSACDNTGVSLLRYENGVFRLEYLYDNSHLSPELSTRTRQRWWREKQGGLFQLWFRDPGPEDEGLYDPDFRPQPGDWVRIAMLGDTAAGYAVCRGSGISALWLKPEHRHRRMGDQLFGEAMFSLRRQGVRELELSVPARCRDALAFFARLGAAAVRKDGENTVCHMEITVPIPVSVDKAGKT